MMARIFPKQQPPIDFLDSVAPLKLVEELSELSGYSIADAFETIYIVIDSIVK